MKKIFLVLAVTFCFYSTIYSQITYPIKFDPQGTPFKNQSSFLLGLPNNETIMFWYDSTYSLIRYVRGDSEMTIWTNEDSIENVMSGNNPIEIRAIVLPTGRIYLTYRRSYYYYIYSDDNGYTWSEPTTLYIRPGIVNNTRMFLSSLSLNSNQELCFIHSFSPSTFLSDAKGIFLSKSTNGINWSTMDTIDLEGKNGSLTALTDSNDIVVFQDSTSNGYEIFCRTSTNSGIDWSERSSLLISTSIIKEPITIKDQNNKVWIYYLQNEQTPFSDIYQKDIKFITSTDGGKNWSASEKLTKYVGHDFNHNVSLVNGRPILSFNSTRDYYNTYSFTRIYSTYGDLQIDLNTPPFLYKSEHTIFNPGIGEQYFVRAFCDDDSEILSAKLNSYRYPPGVTELIDMYDDGAHNDSLSGDNIYGAFIPIQNYGDWIQYHFILEDNDFNNVTFSGGFIETPNTYASDTYLFKINKLKLPLSNRGILAAVNINGIENLQFDESSVLYSGGFYLSGFNNGTLWANAMATSSLVEDYQAGLVGSQIDDPLNKIYIIKNSDQDFGPAWQVYQHAVQQGADFYDGNGDSIYNPVDLNGNSQWDLNEDRPDILGDETAWCVYNDGIPGNSRRWNDQQPMGIEIQQTLFGWNKDANNPINNMIFLRYRIINTGTVSDIFDSVYFSCWADPDLGKDSYDDDLVGSDVNLNLGYAYNSGEDLSYGTNPPSFGIPFLQGPAAYIPGETFVDINGNGIFDFETDQPLDTAYMFNGPILGIEIIPGAKNQELKSFIEYIIHDPALWDPEVAIEARNYMLGLMRSGNSIDPCNFQYGQVFGMDCNLVDPRFLYSGDPITNFGWINTTQADQRFLLSTGPFDLEVNKPVDIIACYLVGRGTDALNSVSVMKDLSEVAKEIYQSNFTSIPTGIDNQPATITDFKLNQNYPNPFNPTTKISWQTPVAGQQTLKVYDVLGNEVATLVNEFRNAGSYEVDFNASKLSSGVYFYQLKAGDYIQTKKMILIK